MYKNYEYVFFNSSVGSKEIKILFKPEGTSDRELRSYIEPAQPCRDHRRFARSEYVETKQNLELRLILVLAQDVLDIGVTVPAPAPGIGI